MGEREPWSVHQRATVTPMRRLVPTLLVAVACSPARATPAPTSVPLPSVAAVVEAGPPAEHKAIAVALFGARRCTILDDHTVACWKQEQGKPPTKLVPVEGLTSVASFAPAFLGYVIRQDGSVAEWKEVPPDAGAAGVDGGPAGITIKPIAGPHDVVELHIGDPSCARSRDGALWCWGDNRSGQLGDGTTVVRDTPVQPAGARDVVSFAVGSSHVLAVLADGSVMGWGSGNALGQTADADTLVPSPVPGLRDVAEVQIGTMHSCARTRGGALWCWGQNEDGELGDGTRQDRTTPVRVVGESGVAGFAIAADIWSGRTCTWHDDGKVACWGGDLSGAVGCDAAHRGSRYIEGPNVSIPSCAQPVLVDEVEGARRVVMGEWSTFALLRSGGVRRWGRDPDTGGPPPNGPVPEEDAAVVDPIGRSDIASMDVADDSNACVVTTAGDVHCTDEPPPPAPAPQSQQHQALAVAVGGGRRCAILDDRSVRCWGSGPDRPRAVPGVSGATSLALGSQFACAVLSDRTVRCWGHNGDGQLGDGTGRARAGSARVAGIEDVQELVAGNDFACARKGDGALWCWGKNDRGQLGDGTRTGRPAPVQVVGSRDVKTFAAGFSGVTALLTDGTLVAFGRTKPAPVPGLRDVVQVQSDWGHTCALRKDGWLWCWGDNSYGEVGDGTLRRRSQPFRVQSNVAGFSVGNNRTCAWRADGTARCWGDDSGGAAACRGANTTKRREEWSPGMFKWWRCCTRPTVVAGLKGVSRMTTGSGTYALLATGAVWSWGESPDLDDEPTITPPSPDDLAHAPGNDTFGRTDVAQLAAGDGACIVTTAGEVYCEGASKTAVQW
jgi:alpha-tubulin suppressor-like RCC1 family protein